MARTQTRTNGPTPNGGAYAIAYWQDAKGDPTPQERAVKAEIIEFTQQGKEVQRTYMTPEQV